MKEVSNLLRLAYLNILSPLVVEGVTIPVLDEMVNPNQQTATYRASQAYVLITDQNEVETSNNFSTFRQTATISLDIITKFPNGSGSRLTSEIISDKIQTQVNLLTGQSINIDNSVIQVLSTTKVSSTSFVEPGQSLVVFRKRITFSHIIIQS
jgi:hypothetical protein